MFPIRRKSLLTWLFIGNKGKCGSMGVWECESISINSFKYYNII